MMRRFQKVFTILGIMVAALCITNVTVKADLIYNTDGVLIETYNVYTLTNATDGSYKRVSSEAGTISYYDANGNLLKIVDKNTEEILFTVNEDGTLAKVEPTTEAETTAVEETTTKEVEKITLPKVKKLSKKTKWSKYKGVKAVKKDKNKTPIWGKIKYRYGITLTWKRVKGVTGYEIYRYENAAKKWTKIKTIKKNKKKPSYTLTDMLKGENVKIKVRAYKNTKSGKVYGEYSKVLKFKTKHLYTKVYKNARQKSFYSKWASQDAFVIQNKYRKTAGVEPLIWSDSLYEIAVIRTKMMYKKDGLSHDGISRDTRTFLKQYGITETEYIRDNGLWIRGENIASQFYTPKRVMEAWKKSEGHNRILKNSKYQSGAIAVYESDAKNYWSSEFSHIDYDMTLKKCIEE